MGELITHQDEEQIVQRDESSWLIEGLTPINEVMRCLAIEEFPDRIQYETIAGFMIYTLKRLPKRTDHFTHQGYKFEVLDLEGVRVEQILVTKLK
jgi:CBS domain containing-hemolysin-like protein